MAQNSRRLLKTVAEIGTVAAASTLLTLLVPMVLGKSEDPQRQQARLECERIGAALRQFVADTGSAPRERGVTDPKPLHCLRGAGKLSPVNPFDDGPSGDLAMYLAAAPAETDSETWKGPYLLSIEADPWGNAYAVNVHAIGNESEVAWVLSPGPNGVLETPAVSESLVGDDVGVVID